MNTRVVVVGAGAVGGFVGGLLSAAGDDVTLMGRPRVLDAIRDRGLTVRLLSGESKVTHPRVAEATAAADVRAFDWVVLAVKAYDVEGSLDAVAELLGAQGTVIALQNGVGSDDLLTARFGPGRVVAATLTVSVGMDEPGIVSQYSRAGGLAVAPYSVPEVSGRAAAVLDRTQLAVEQLESPAALRWSKLFLNMLTAVQSAVLDVTPALIAHDSRLFSIEQRAAREALAVMRAAGIAVCDLPGYPVRAAATLMRMPQPVAQTIMARRLAGSRGGRAPTLRGDIQAGRRNESIFLNGAVAPAGTEYGVPTPVNAALQELADIAAADEAKRDLFRGNPRALLAWMERHGIDV